MNLLGIHASTKLLKIWAKLLVYPAAPFFLTDESARRIPILKLTRHEFRATIQDLSFHDSYTTYNVASEAIWVTLLSSQKLQEFPKKVRLELLQLQTSLGRGQIYKLDEYKNILTKNELRQAYQHTFDFEGKEMLELNYQLWQDFSFKTQKRWLAKFVREDKTDCLWGTLSKKEQQAMSKHYPAVKRLVGFTNSSGSNCFATTLAALCNVGEARGVSSLWLQRETFLREIEKRGYQKSELEAKADLSDGSILVWQNDHGIQHACLYVRNGFVFNKDAQGWFAPRQILKVETVTESWKDCHMSVYVKR